jgi:hypothetical protein
VALAAGFALAAALSHVAMMAFPEVSGTDGLWSVVPISALGALGAGVASHRLTGGRLASLAVAAARPPARQRSGDVCASCPEVRAWVDQKFPGLARAGPDQPSPTAWRSGRRVVRLEVALGWRRRVVVFGMAASHIDTR